MRSKWQQKKNKSVFEDRVLWVLQHDAYYLFLVCAQNGGCATSNDISMHKSGKAVTVDSIAVDVGRV